MPYNIIGDIHGLQNWKKVVREDCNNIFVGDYFDSKNGLTIDNVIHNFYDIIAFRLKHPNTILLYGNHDLNYIINADYRSQFSRIDCRETFAQLLNDNNQLFYGVAFAINDKTLVSHAGVTHEWYKKFIGEYNGEGAISVADKINQLWVHNKNAFTFSTNACMIHDKWGESATHSPLWIRAWILPQHNLFNNTDIVQIVGHTPQEDITQLHKRIFCVDCLHKKTKSLLWTDSQLDNL